MFSNILFKQYKSTVDRTIDFFASRISNPKLYERIITKCKLAPQARNDEYHDTKLNLNLLTMNNYLYFYGDVAKKEGIPILVVEKTLERLCEIGVLSVQNFVFNHQQNIPYALHDTYVEFLNKNNALKNLFYNFNYIIEKYKNSIFKISVETNNGCSIGTGFLVNMLDKQIIVTNKHVAKYKENLTIHSVDSVEILYSEILISSDADLAIIVLKTKVLEESFNFLCQTNILDEVITIGYPRVAMTNDNYQLSHKGEINAMVSDFTGSEYIIFSAKTAPGNSGGPLINKFGLVVGIVTQDFIENNKESIILTPYFAAIPSEVIINTINDLLEK